MDFTKTQRPINNLSRRYQSSHNCSILTTPKECLEVVRNRDPEQKEFFQAVSEVIESCTPLWKKYPDYICTIPAICEPDRIIQFKVPWVDDKGQTHINRGYRVQFNQCIGPYKGGLRFHPSVNLSIMKFLGFEQIFKNALTGLPMGGAKGGSDFNPKNKSDAEILRFCQSFMSQLYNYIGPDKDVPAGDIGVGSREIGYLFGEYKTITCQHNGVLTGKNFGWGGSQIRPEATGYGLVYILKMALNDINEKIENKRIAVTGAGNVATYCVEKLLQYNACVISMSDSNGCIIEEKGFTKQQFDIICEIKKKRQRIKEYLKYSNTCKYIENDRPWKYVQCDIAMPCATQNEINEEEAHKLIENGCYAVVEGANMPSTSEAIHVFKQECKIFVPSKAANAGGVSVSGLEMSQNSQRLYWTREEVDQKLYNIMQDIYNNIKLTSQDLGYENDLQLGANAYGFRKVADAMFDHGFVLKSWTPVEQLYI